VVIFIPFNYLKRKYTDKLAVSNFFGNLEFYLGMLGGMIRFACMALFVLAMLNAPFYSQQQIINQQNYDKTNFGGGTYEGSYFPHLFTIQDDVFVKSFTGPQIKNFLNPLLITTVDTVQTQRKSVSTNP
ncbi:MAG TPA: hypothetical protein VHG71_09205, partial [Verrucomicrobiae bacterium]|nr:hypothetical protein [Verrucomicrobiae bacterium]